MPSYNGHAFGFLAGIRSLTLVTCTSTSLNACFGSKNLLSILSGARKPSKDKKTTKCFEIHEIWWPSPIANSNQWPPLTLTDDKDLCRLIPGRLRLSSLHLLEELLEDPEQWLVVFGAEDLGDKGATFGQKVTGQLESHEGQMCWKGKKMYFQSDYNRNLSAAGRIKIKFNFLWHKPCEKASCCQLAPTFGAPSFNTTSTFQVCSSFLKAWTTTTTNEQP